MDVGLIIEMCLHGPRKGLSRIPAYPIQLLGLEINMVSLP